MEDEKKKRGRPGKKVVQYSLSGEYLKCWDSITQAAKNTGVSASSISNCCSGKYETAGGYMWLYYDYVMNITEDYC